MPARAPAKAPGKLFGANATVAQAPNDRSGRIACRPATSTPTRCRGRPAPSRVIHGSARPDGSSSAAPPTRATATGPLGTAFENEGTSQPKFDARVDQEIERRPHHLPGRRRRHRAASSTPASGRSTSSPGSYMGYGKVNYRQRCAEAQLLHQLHQRRGAEPAAADPAHRAAAAAQLLDPDLRLRGRRRLPRRHAPGLQRRRQRPAQQLRHHDRAEQPRTAPSSAPTCRTRSSSTAFGFTLGGRVDKFGNLERSGLLAAAGRGLQGRRRSLAPRLVQPRVPLAVGDQQLPRHQHRRPDRSERPGAALPRRCSRWSRAVSAGRAGGRQPAADWRDAAGRAGRGVADRLRGRLHRHVRRTHDARRGVLRQRSRRQHQLLAAADNLDPVHGGQPAARLAAAAGGPHRCWRSAAFSCRAPRSPI